MTLMPGIIAVNCVFNAVFSQDCGDVALTVYNAVFFSLQDCGHVALV